MFSVSHELVCFLIRPVTSCLFFFFDMVSSGFGITYFPHMSLPLELHVAGIFQGEWRAHCWGGELLTLLLALCLHEQFIFLLGLVLFGFGVFTVGYVWTKRYFSTNNGKSDPSGKGAACLLRLLVYLSPLSLWWLNLSLGFNGLNFDLL